MRYTGSGSHCIFWPRQNGRITRFRKTAFGFQGKAILENDPIPSGDDILAQSCRIALEVFRRGLEHFAGYAGADVASVDSAWPPAANVPADGALAEIIATAGQLTSGLAPGAKEEAGGHGGSSARALRLPSLLEGIDPDREPGSPGTNDCPRHWMPLQAFSPNALFAQSGDGETASHAGAGGALAQADYAGLWKQFVAALHSIPKNHRANLPLWLDHFDACWLAFAHAIPSAAEPGVSLYDHGKVAAALATALWRWRQAGIQAGEGGQKEFLLIQGDFSGIQSFIFASGGQTQRSAARLLRGRSFQVSLLTELAALAVLQALDLPPSSQITNAAGKFLIVAPNLPYTEGALRKVRQSLDQWCLQHSFGEISVSIVALPAAGSDFAQKNFSGLMARLFQVLDTAKLSRFDLCGDDAPKAVRHAEFPNGPCAYDGQRPAQEQPEDQDGKRYWASPLSADQIAIGKNLAAPGYTRLLIASGREGLRDGGPVRPLKLDYFGYAVAFARDEDAAGKFGDLARQGALLRCWDFSLPDDAGAPLFHGYARRDINAYVPVRDEVEQLITLDEIAQQDPAITALAVLKGDVDRLGAIFQHGIPRATFARMAALSRQMNAFFAVYLPWLCRKRFPDTYTVFAGGDDFFLIGPWEQTQNLARRSREDFGRFAAGNPKLTFSASIVIAGHRTPIRALAAMAEKALKNAKNAAKERNRLCSHGQIVTWEQRKQLAEFESWLEQRHAQFSTGFVYRLLHLAEKAASDKPEDAIWQSWLAYRVRRFVVDKLPKEQHGSAQTELAGRLRPAIAEHKQALRIAVANYLYRHRD